MRIKRPAEYSMGIDIDAAVIQKFCQENPTACSTYVRDAIKWLYPPHIYLCDDPSTLVYLDPPYLMSTRSAGRAIYRHEFATEEEHRELLELIRGLHCMVMISGYYSDLYAQELHDWRLVQFQSQTRGGPATECVWLNFPPPVELHDYRFLGGDFRERERIKRKQVRWRQRLASMPDTERYAMLSVIEGLRTTGNNQQ